MKQNVLVTGASGFIGKPLVNALGDARHNVLVLKGDITDAEIFKQLDSLDVDFVFHLAGRTFVPDSWDNPADFERVNVSGTMSVLDFCRKRQIPLTYLSAYLYGAPKKLPICETDEIVPNNPYALSKFMAESACEFYAKHYLVPVTIIRPFNIYGPEQKEHFLIPEILAQVKSKTSIKLKDLKPRRDYLYVDDLIEALLLTMSPSKGCRTYNIGSGTSLSVEEIVTTIQSEAGTSLPVKNENLPRKNEMSDVYADISLAKQELNWQPKTSFAEGIKNIFLTGANAI